MDLTIHVHHYIHAEPACGEIKQTLDQLLAQGVAMSAATDKITAEVTETKGIIQSAITLIGSIAAQIRENKADQTALDALADSLDTDSSALAAAVAANSPAPVEPPAPTV